MHHAPEILRKEGHKLTPQRLLIWNILEKGKHFTANQLHQKVQQKFQGVDLATVYRTLELLTNHGFVQESSFASGPARYEITDEIGHTHIACPRCTKIEHFEDEKLLKMISKICKNKRFCEDNIEITITSICKSCLEKVN